VQSASHSTLPYATFLKRRVAALTQQQHPQQQQQQQQQQQHISHTNSLLRPSLSVDTTTTTTSSSDHIGPFLSPSLSTSATPTPSNKWTSSAPNHNNSSNGNSINTTNYSNNGFKAARRASRLVFAPPMSFVFPQSVVDRLEQQVEDELRAKRSDELARLAISLPEFSSNEPFADQRVRRKGVVHDNKVLPVVMASSTSLSNSQLC
jgi:transcription initiation factor TFIID subunit TAF12